MVNVSTALEQHTKFKQSKNRFIDDDVTSVMSRSRNYRCASVWSGTKMIENATIDNTTTLSADSLTRDQLTINRPIKMP